MPKYRTAAQLGILPEERKALIAFVNAPALGRTIALNGHAHYYDQGEAQNYTEAEENHCGTAGCVAGFVFAHARVVQGKRTLRQARDAEAPGDWIIKGVKGEFYPCKPDIFAATYEPVTGEG